MQYKSKCCQSDFTEFKLPHDDFNFFEDYCAYYKGYIATCNKCQKKCEIVRYDVEL
jgi:hypothetical protein